MAIACDTRHAAHNVKCSLPAGHAGPHLAPFTWTGDGRAALPPPAIYEEPEPAPQAAEPPPQELKLAATPPRTRKPW